MCRNDQIDLDAACISHGISVGSQRKSVSERVTAVRDRILELGLLDLELSKPIDRDLVDELRTRVKVSVAQAAAAVAKHGADLDAAYEDLCTQLVQHSDEHREEQPMKEEAEGLTLYLSERSTTGYTGVVKSASGKFYEARSGAKGQATRLGVFDTPVEAAVAYAKHKQTLGPDGVEGEEDDDNDPASMNVKLESESACEGEVGRVSRAPNACVDPEERSRKLEHQATMNRNIEPLLAKGSEAPSGVIKGQVNSQDATRCADFLQQHWTNGRLPLPGGHKCYGWASYGNTLGSHDAEQQRTNTLLLTHAMLPAVRKHVPGFVEMEETLTAWLNQRVDCLVELFYAHGLRQSPETLRSTAFGIHQDTEYFPFIEHSVIVKLTADARGEAPSQMAIIGADRHFEYGPQAGACALFRASLYHASVPPVSSREHIKIAFFFRACANARKIARVKRPLVSGDGTADEPSAARRRMGAPQSDGGR